MKRHILRIAQHFAFYLIIVSITLTISVSLFTRGLETSMMRSLTREEITLSAQLTFIACIILSVVFTLADHIFYLVTLQRKLDMILAFTDSLAEGNFTQELDTRTVFEDDFDKIAENLNMLARELNSIQILKSDFISTVSHEFRTPLSIITSYAELLRDDYDPAYADVILRTAHRLTNLVSDVLRLTKLENQQICSSETFSLSELVRTIAIDWEERIEAKGLELIADIPQEISICSDRNLVSIVITNFISNAVKFTQKGSITVVLRNTDEGVLFSVSDTGCGIERAELPHVFEKYYQAGNSDHDGNGLGLALVRRIADILSIRLSAESTPGQGSCFSFLIETNQK